MLDGGVTQPEWTVVRGGVRAFSAVCLALGLGWSTLALGDAAATDSGVAVAVTHAEAAATDDALSRARAELATVEQQVKDLHASEHRLRAERSAQSREYSRLMQVVERQDPKVKAMKAQVRAARESLSRQQKELDDYLQTLPALQRWSEAQQAGMERLRDAPRQRMELLTEMGRLRSEILLLEQGDVKSAQQAPQFEAPSARVETTETTKPGASD